MSDKPIAQEALMVLFEAVRWKLLFHDGTFDPLAVRSGNADGRCRLPVSAVQVTQRKVVVCQP
jgi:hypothetical protein